MTPGRRYLSITGAVAGALLAAIAALSLPALPAAGQPAPNCTNAPELRQALREIEVAANANRLAEFFRLNVRALPLFRRECGFGQPIVRQLMLYHLRSLLALGRVNDVDQLAAEAIAGEASGEDAGELRLQLLALRIRTAVMRRNARDLEAHYLAYQEALADRPDPVEIAETMAWVRRCRERNAVSAQCRDLEDTTLYGHFSFDNGVLSGQCPPGQEALPTRLTVPGAPFSVVARPARALNAACAREPAIARLAADWLAARNRGDPAAFEIAPRLANELDIWATEIDGFDGDNPVSRLQVRGLAFYVRFEDRRLRCGRLCIAYPPEEMQRRDREKQALRPYLEAALPAILRGEEGFLRTDTVGLAGFLVSQASWMGDAAQAEFVWQLIGRTFPDRGAADAVPFEDVRRRLDPQEALVTTLHPADGIGVILVARQSGYFVLRELDAPATLVRSVGALLLDAGSHPPGDRGFPIHGARLLYNQYVCPVEALGPGAGVPTSLVFVPDPALERVPITLLARPAGDCINPRVRWDQPFREGRRDELASVRWVGDDYAVRIMPFAAVDRPAGAASAKGYLGIGAARPRRRLTDLFAPARSVIEQQSDYVASLSPLSGAVAELQAAGELPEAGSAERLVGEEATEANLRGALLRPRRIVHFATHALDPATNPRVIEPLLMLTRPSSGPFDPLNDGVLSSSEAAQLRLPHATVLLSACRTAAPRAGLGAGLFSGLVLGFFEAGAEQALATYWPIDDEAAAVMVPEVVRATARGVPIWAAVRDAQRAFRQRATGSRARWRHPYYWGAFVAVSPNVRTAPDR